MDKKIKFLRDASEWKHLNLDRLNLAISLGKQQESWSCGPSSGYRALVLNGDETSRENLQAFIKRCPKTSGKAQTKKGRSIDPRFQLHVPVVNKTLTSKRLSEFFPDIGPKPRKLAKYISGYSKTSVTGKTFKEFGEFKKKICNSIEQGKPTVILLQIKSGNNSKSMTDGFFTLHYVNVVGFNKSTNEFAILDTGSVVDPTGHGEILSFLDETTFSKHSAITAFYLKGRFHAVCFQ